MSDLHLDPSSWRFLQAPARYSSKDSTLRLEPLRRQFRTAEEVLKRLADGRGVLLADDVGLGKTTVGALVAWALACQGKRVRIYAPNKPLQRRWAEELGRHADVLGKIEQYEASRKRIRAADVGKLHPGRIQVTTHHALIMSHGNGEQKTACDLMIIDEAHRAKDEDGQFNKAVATLGNHAKRKLILTATPFSIQIGELAQLLAFVGAKQEPQSAVRAYAARLARLQSLGPGHDAQEEARELVREAKAAIDALRPFLIRHGIADLPECEQKHFGVVEPTNWQIATRAVTDEELRLLLRVDRIRQLTPGHKNKRRNDPRFHLGWLQVRHALKSASDHAEEIEDEADRMVTRRHIRAAEDTLRIVTAKPHPKAEAVSKSIEKVVSAGEKVLVFCQHYATASELLRVLERALATKVSPAGPSKPVWEAAWRELWRDRLNDPLLVPIISWLCTPGIRAQIGGWIGEPAPTSGGLSRQFRTQRVRNAGDNVPTVFEAADALARSLLDPESKSTLGLLRSMAKQTPASESMKVRFPGRLDDGYRVMGAWKDQQAARDLATLYTGSADIVLALFNSPFGPDVLVTTDWVSEGVDLHRYCRHLVHYELHPSPVRTLQRNGRLRRVGSWAALTGRPIQYAYPAFRGTRDERAVIVMQQRLNAFDLLLGGVPPLDEGSEQETQSFTDVVLCSAREHLRSINRGLCVGKRVEMPR